MSAVIDLEPLISAYWPEIEAAAVAAATALGLTEEEKASLETKVQDPAVNTVEVELAGREEVKQNLHTGQEIVLTRGGVVLKVRRDERGRCSVCATGKGQTEAQLRALAEEFAEKMTQSFVYNRVMTELKAKGFQVVNEEMAKDDSVRIHVRRWEG